MRTYSGFFRWNHLIAFVSASLLPLLIFNLSCQVTLDPSKEGFPCNPDNDCEEGLECIDGICTADPCARIDCGETEECIDGKCHIVGCSDTSCPENTLCVYGGECAPRHCEHIDCDDGEVCDVDGESCVEPACYGIVCRGDRICVRGSCYWLNCPSDDCASNQVCVEDKCVDIACLEANCEVGTICNEGICIPGCIIDGAFYEPNENAPTNNCLACKPDLATSEWTPEDPETACFTGVYCLEDSFCNEVGECIGGIERDCSHLDDICLVGVCNEEEESCIAQPKAVGTECGIDKTCNEEGKCTNIGSCLLPWGGSILDGERITAFQRSSVSYLETCVSEERMCNNGILSGSYRHQSCEVREPADCSTPWGVTLPHTESVTAYESPDVRHNETCSSEQRHCDDGSLSGSYRYETCSVNPPQNCTLPWGGTLAHGQSVTAYQTSTVPYGSTCNDALRSCNDGNLSGSFTNQSCRVADPSNCTLPWGGALAHGQSVTAYQSASVPYGSNCNSESRQCYNGNLSGSFTDQSCQVADPSNCTLPWGGTLAHGQSVTAYQSAWLPYGSVCNPEARQCNNGTLSGSFSHQQCNHRYCGDGVVTDKEATFAEEMVLLYLDEGTGTVAYDSSGNNNDAHLNNVTWTTGKFGGGLHFTGTMDNSQPTSYLNVPYDRPVNNFTMMAWVRTQHAHTIDSESTSGTTGTSGQRYVFSPQYGGAAGDQAGAGVSVGTNGVSVYEHAGGYMPALAVYNGHIGTNWVHVAVTYTNRQPRIYVNGELVRTGLTSTIPTVQATNMIGGGSYGALNGQMDHVRIISRPLSAAEIRDAMGEACDDGHLNGQPGRCKTDCSGYNP